jgi:hypothetical protein
MRPINKEINIDITVTSTGICKLLLRNEYYLLVFISCCQCSTSFLPNVCYNVSELCQWVSSFSEVYLCVSFYHLHCSLSKSVQSGELRDLTKYSQHQLRAHYSSPRSALTQLLQQRSKTCPIKWLLLVQYCPDFFHHGGSNHLHGLLPRISDSQESLE